MSTSSKFLLGLTLLTSAAIAAPHPTYLALSQMKTAEEIAVTPEGAVLVAGLDRFLRKLQPVGYEGVFVLVKDTKTGSQYLIKKVK
jgi:hypothetical protein